MGKISLKKYGFVKASLYDIHYKGYEEDDSFLLIHIFDKNKYFFFCGINQISDLS